MNKKKYGNETIESIASIIRVHERTLRRWIKGKGRPSQDQIDILRDFGIILPGAEKIQLDSVPVETDSLISALSAIQKYGERKAGPKPKQEDYEREYEFRNAMMKWNRTRRKPI